MRNGMRVRAYESSRETPWLADTSPSMAAALPGRSDQARRQREVLPASRLPVTYGEALRKLLPRQFRIPIAPLFPVVACAPSKVQYQSPFAPRVVRVPV